MRRTKSLLAPVMVIILLGGGFGCQTLTATKSQAGTSTPSSVPFSREPSTSAVPEPTSATPPASPPSTTFAPAPTSKQSATLNPAKFVLGDLTITPAAIMAGDKVTYSIQVSNVGGTEGSYVVVFKHKSSAGSVGSDNVEVALQPGQTKTATFTTTQNETGTYLVNVNDKNSQYSVTPRLVAKPFARQTKIEVVTNSAAAFNPKGGNQTRIVRTKDGVFTVYIVEHNGDFDHEWRLAKRQSNGTWTIIAQGDAGTFPANLLASPDGTLHVIGWSNGIGTMWSGTPKDGNLVMASTRIPNVIQGDYPYPAAGIDASGNICVLTSVGNKTSPSIMEGPFTGAEFRWAFYMPSQSRWVTQTNELDVRYTYAYVFPRPNGQLSLVASRDCEWKELGYSQPPGTFGCIFNALQYWRTEDVSSETIKAISFAEEKPTDQYPNPFLTIQMDAYLDTKDRMHIIYEKHGATTSGEAQTRHRIVSASGNTLFDEKLPLSKEAGQFCRIFQDSQERFYLLNSLGLLYPMGKEGQDLGDPMQLDLEGRRVAWTGYGLSVQRTGTQLSDLMDVGFVSDDGKGWYYFQLDFSGQ